ncbi:acyl-CoA synthetase [Candidatus Mycalebacterium sp.]
MTYGRVDAVRHRCPNLKTVFITGGKAPSRCVDLDELVRKSSAELEPADTLSEDIAYICYTSGTTGEPKGVVHAHRCIIGRDPAAFFWLGVRDRPKVFHAGKLNWTYTLGAGCLDPWRHGCASVIYGGEYEPRKMFEIIEKHRANVFMAVPTVYRQMLRAAKDAPRPDLSSVSHCLSAGETLSPELFSAWKDELGVSLYNGLGMSEFSYYVSNMIGMEINPESPGKPQPGRKCFLANPETGEKVADAREGVLVSAPDDPGIMLGYWNKPEETRAMFSPKGDFMSGDYFTADDDGYLLPLGRRDDMINSFGYRISPFEIEAALSKHGKVGDCAAVGIDAGGGKIITTAFVVTKEPAGESRDSLKKELRDFLEKRLAKYKMPKEIVFTDSIPVTKNGKKKRGELREQFSMTD